MMGDTGRMSEGSPGGLAGKDTLRRNSMNKDTEAGKSADSLGNSKEVLYRWLQRACGQRFDRRQGGQRQIMTRPSLAILTIS